MNLENPHTESIMGVIADSFSARLQELAKRHEESDRMLQEHLQKLEEIIESLDEICKYDD